MAQKESNTLLIRADAGARIGAGHLMRCLALAQGWQASGGQVIFITACESEGLRRRLSDEGFQVTKVERAYPDTRDWHITSQVLANHAGAWVLLDGYNFDAVYQQQIKASGHPLLMIDDTAHQAYYYADMVLNQNINAERLAYSCQPTTRLLLGMRYVLLRSEFVRWRDWERAIPKLARKVLVTLGGGDRDNQTLKVIQALQQVAQDALDLLVVVGGSNPHFPALQAAADESRVSIRLVRNANNMAELMAWADVAISAGGSTCWELAFMGLPNLILVLADNQKGIAEGLAEQGVALNLGWFKQVTSPKIAETLSDLLQNHEQRQQMSRQGRLLIDGFGRERVVSSITATKPVEQTRIRLAGSSDVELLWRWANEPTVRANSFDSQPIPLEQHLKWVQKKLESPQTRIWLLELNQVPVAQIRYDRIDPDTAQIGFSVASGYRGKGLGTRLLLMTVAQACQELKVKRLKGVVFTSNKASGRAFIKAGFECVAQEEVSDEPCYIFIWECDKYYAS